MPVDLERLRAALPGYDIGAELGRGAWGVVVAGTHVALGRDVAIKQLPEALAEDPAVRRRFVAEARVVGSLDHPHIVRVFDYVEREGLLLLVMELLPGGSLAERLERGPLALPEACGVVIAAAGGLQYAHDRGILHRDVKPHNVMFTATGTVKLGDFGIAKVLGVATTGTATGQVMGTPAYIAPEQATGGAVGPGTDVYAAGIMLYELVAGRLPFDFAEGGVLSQLYQHVNEPPLPLADAAPTAPEEVCAVVHRALEKEPGDRYPSAEAFGVALAEAATGAFGPGWLSASGVPVLASGPIVAAAERGAVPPSIAPPEPGPSLPDGDRPRRRRLVPLLGALALAAGAVVAAIFLLGGDDGDGGSGDAAPSPPATSVGTIPESSITAFRDECRAQGVAQERCECVIDGVTGALSADQFQENLDLMSSTEGGLTTEVAAVFDDCVEQGR